MRLRLYFYGSVIGLLVLTGFIGYASLDVARVMFYIWFLTFAIFGLHISTKLRLRFFYFFPLLWVLVSSVNVALSLIGVGGFGNLELIIKNILMVFLTIEMLRISFSSSENESYLSKRQWQIAALLCLLVVVLPLAKMSNIYFLISLSNIKIIHYFMVAFCGNLLLSGKEEDSQKPETYLFYFLTMLSLINITFRFFENMRFLGN